MRKLTIFSKRKLEILAEYGVGDILIRDDEALGKGIYQYSDPIQSMCLSIYEQGIVYLKDNRRVVLRYDEMVRVSTAVTLRDVCRINSKRLIDEIVSLIVETKVRTIEILVPFKVYSNLSSFLMQLINES